MSSKAVDLNLLSTFHVREYKTHTALGQLVRFLLLAAVWISIVFVAAAGAGLTFAWLLPWLILNPLNGIMPSQEFAQSVAQALAYLAPTVTIATVIPVNAMFLVLLERKFLALLTMRRGPTNVGPNGGLQTFADALKLLFKEDIVPDGADKLLFTLAPALFFAPAMIVFLPLLSIASNNLGSFIYTNIDIGILFIIGISSLGTMSIVMGGWASNNKYSLMGGMRAASQAISYEIPMVLSTISIIMMTGSMNLFTISESQAGGILSWNIFGNGHSSDLINLVASSGGDLQHGLASLLFVGLCVALFIIFLISSTAEVNRIPFDLPEAESELVSGFNTEYTGMKFALFFLAEYTNLFVVSALLVTLFLGGSHLPIGIELEKALYASLSDISIHLPMLGTLGGLLKHVNLVWALTTMVLMLKIYIMISVSVWIRATLPRLRQDQLLEFGWTYLIPLTLGIIFVMALLLEYIK